MPLDELVRVIDKIKERIEEHRTILGGHETRTRTALMDPMLQALGWDVSDPALVTVEYNVASGRADYALLSVDGKPRVFLEAKRLGESLIRHRSQMVTYAVELGTPYSALSDGDKWEVYDTFKQVALDKKRILNISIAADPAPQIALQFLLLWRANITLDRPEIAPEPIVKVAHTSSGEPEPVTKPAPTVNPGKGWTRLTEFAVVPRTKAPPFIRFSDHEEKEVKNWRLLFVEVARWLVREGILNRQICPVIGARKGTFYAHTESFHDDRTPFRAPYEVGNGIFVPAHGSGAAMVDRSRRLLERVGQDPSQVYLKTG